MRYFLPLFFSIWLNDCLHAQVSFQNLISVQPIANPIQPWDIIQTSDSGYAICGTTNVIGNDDFMLMRTDKYGTPLWIKVFGETNLDQAFAVKQTPDDGFIIVGTTMSFGYAPMNIMVVKTDGNGILQWSKVIGSVGLNQGFYVEPLNNGYFIGGIRNGAMPVMIRTDLLGNVLWEKSYGSNITVSLYNPPSFHMLADSNLVIAGKKNGAFLMKINHLTGAILWANDYDNASSQSYSVNELSNGDLIVCGGRDNSIGFLDHFVMKTNSVGTVIWDVNFEGTENIEPSYFATTSPNDQIYVYGNRYDGVYWNAQVIRFQTNGQPLWYKDFGPDYLIGNIVDGLSMITTSGNGFAFVTPDNFSTNTFLVKADSSGQSGCNESVGSFSSQPITVSSSASIVTANTIVDSVITPIIISQDLIPAQQYLCPLNITTVHPSKTIALFPNPINSNSLIQFQAPELVEAVSIYSTDGSLVKMFDHPNGNIQLSEKDFPAGLFLVLVTMKNGETQTLRFTSEN